ncbi:hypothetical protein QQX98_004071 [Neonectria punicea]|uniref:C2H2-type domain-containing protein n=1 Tax=Neonectria punicea TaxID=979145 RepID=A0ABR1HB37_9HYPO
MLDAEEHRDTFTFDTTNLYFPSNHCLQPFAQSQKFPFTGIGSWSSSTSSYPTPTASPKLGTTKERPKEPRQILPAKPAAEPSRPKKRSRQSSLRVDGTKQPVDDNDPKTQFLACPFYKRDQKKYQDCLKYKLQRPKDVKQHIFRRHMRPEFYCARCFKTFSAAEDRDRHTRELQCERVDDPQFDGISSKQHKLLKDYISQNRTFEQQWFDTWCIIFPDQTQMQPTSCYSGNHVEETVSQLRTFWDLKKSEMLPGILSDNEFKALNPCLIDKVISTILTRVESEMSRSAVKIAPKLPLAIPPTSTQHVQEVNVKSDQSQENDASDEDRDLQLDKELFGDMVYLPSDDGEDLPMKW